MLINMISLPLYKLRKFDIVTNPSSKKNHFFYYKYMFVTIIYIHNKKWFFWTMGLWQFYIYINFKMVVKKILVYIWFFNFLKLSTLIKAIEAYLLDVARLMSKFLSTKIKKRNINLVKWPNIRCLFLVSIMYLIWFIFICVWSSRWSNWGQRIKLNIRTT